MSGDLRSRRRALLSNAARRTLTGRSCTTRTIAPPRPSQRLTVKATA